MSLKKSVNINSKNKKTRNQTYHSMDPIQASSDLTPTAQDPNSDQPKPSGLTDRMSRREMLQRWQEYVIY